MAQSGGENGTAEAHVPAMRAYMDTTKRQNAYRMPEMQVGLLVPSTKGGR